MEDDIERPSATRSVATFLLEALLLFAVLALPYFALGSTNGYLASATVALAYGFWPYLSAFIWRPPESPSRLGVFGFACLQFFLAPAVVNWGVAIVVSSWMAWGYRLEGRDLPITITAPGGLHLLTFAALLVLVTVAIASLSLLFLRPGKESFAALRQRIRAGAFRDAMLAPLAGLMVGLLPTGLLVMVSIIALSSILDVLTQQSSSNVMWELAVLLPGFPAGLFAIATVLALHRRLIPVILARIPSHRGHDPQSWPRSAGLVLASLGGVAAIMGAIVFHVHLGAVGLLGMAAQTTPSLSIAQALEDWVRDQRATGLTGAEIAAILQQDGTWIPEASDAGLVRLLPELGEAETGGSLLESGCRVSIAAAVADPAELRGIKRLGSDQPDSDLKYCFAVACPAPMLWESEPQLFLYSSHFSENRLWLGPYYIDLFAQGVAEPGGYCTTSGALSDRFLG